MNSYRHLEAILANTWRTLWFPNRSRLPGDMISQVRKHTHTLICKQRNTQRWSPHFLMSPDPEIYRAQWRRFQDQTYCRVNIDNPTGPAAFAERSGRSLHESRTDFSTYPLTHRQSHLSRKTRSHAATSRLLYRAASVMFPAASLGKFRHC